MDFEKLKGKRWKVSVVAEYDNFDSCTIAPSPLGEEFCLIHTFDDEEDLHLRVGAIVSIQPSLEEDEEEETEEVEETEAEPEPEVPRKKKNKGGLFPW